MRSFYEGEIVRITDGFAHIGEIDRVTEVSKSTERIYKLERVRGWWQHSQLAEADKVERRKWFVENMSPYTCPKCGKPTITQGQYCSAECGIAAAQD